MCDEILKIDPIFNVGIPEKIYHYTTVKSAQNILTHGSLKFSEINKLNDPYDCKNLVDYQSLCHMSHDKRIPKKSQVRKDELNDRNNKFGLICLTETDSNELMWSHYGDSHKGVCIEIDCYKLFKMIYRENKKYKTFINISPVNYTKISPTIYVPNYNCDGEMKEYVKNTFLTKALYWNYEKEWRIIKLFNDTQELLYNPPHYRFFKYIDKIITGVYFGCNMEGKDVVELHNQIGHKIDKYKMIKNDINPHNYQLIPEKL
jgi:hypothetical protein